MKVLLVIHGYPPRYNVGSEVYTQTLAQALADRHTVHVFTRQENAFLAEYAMQTESDSADGRVTLSVINLGGARTGTDTRKSIGGSAIFSTVLNPRSFTSAT